MRAKLALYLCAQGASVDVISGSIRLIERTEAQYLRDIFVARAMAAASLIVAVVAVTFGF